MTTAHMKMPLIARGSFIVSGDDIIASCTTSTIDAEEGRANAAHIVKCVNLHEELVEALLDAKYALYGNGPCNPKIVNALKKAGAL